MVIGDDGSKGERAGPQAWLRDLHRLLSGELTGVGTLRDRGLAISAWRLSACVILMAMFYGLCMGTFAAFRGKSAEPMQMVASMVKVPLLFYLTLIVTLPSLYVFNALVGSRLSPLGVVRLLVASVAVSVTVLASLGPIVAFFSVCTTSYPFMILLNVVVFAVSGLFGLRFLLQTLHRLTMAAEPRPDQPATPPGTWSEAEATGPLEPVRDRAVSQQVKVVFRVWVVVFGLVGAQMGWVLRPFIGNPDLPFTWFRERRSNFFTEVLQALDHLLR